MTINPTGASSIKGNIIRNPSVCRVQGWKVRAFAATSNEDLFIIASEHAPCNGISIILECIARTTPFKLLKYFRAFTDRFGLDTGNFVPLTLPNFLAELVRVILQSQFRLPHLLFLFV
jgi:hypothetical protein